MKELEVAPKLSSKRPRLLLRFRRWLLLSALAVAAITWLVQNHVVACADAFQFAVGDAPLADCILVAGARIYSSGEPYPMLVDRLAIALELFQLGKAPRILVSGRGGGGLAIDEVGAMRRWLVARGVPESALDGDPLGLRTVDSLRRCRAVYNYGSVIVTSNDFHVPRMVFLGRHCGFEASGVVAPPLSHYSRATLWKNRGREVLARVRACIDVYLLGLK